MNIEHAELDEHDRWLAAGAYRHQICEHCDRSQWPPRPVCRSCQGATWSWQDFPRYATLLSWTVVHRSPLPDFSGRPFYAVGILAFAEPGLRVIGRLDADPGTLAPDELFEWSVEPVASFGPQAVWRRSVKTH